jgi:hypothetical protein
VPRSGNGIAALHRIEKDIKGRSADERRAVRAARAKPIFDDMRRWLEQALTQLAPKSDTAAAIHYALGFGMRLRAISTMVASNWTT